MPPHAGEDVVKLDVDGATVGLGLELGLRGSVGVDGSVEIEAQRIWSHVLPEQRCAGVIEGLSSQVITEKGKLAYEQRNQPER